MSVQEIIARKATIGRELRAAVYVAKSVERIVFVSMCINDAGIYYEQDDAQALKVSGESDCAEIGAATRRKLLEFTPRDRNLRDAKGSDWPAFRASGCRTIKSFRNEFSRVNITTINASFRLEASAADEGDVFVGADRSLAVDDLALGKMILHLARAYCLVAEQGLG